MPQDFYLQVFLEGHYSNIYCIEPVNVIIPHNMIPFRVIAPESEWVTYEDADWVDSEKEGTNTPWGSASSYSLTWAGDFKLSNFVDKSFYDIPILAFAYYDGPFAMPKKIRDYIIENEYFQRALLHPFEMIDTDTYSTSSGYKDLSLVNPLTLKYVIHTSQAYSGVPPIINQILLDATFKDSLSSNSLTFINMLLSWAEFVSNNIRNEDVQIEITEVQVHTNNKRCNSNSIISIPLRPNVEYMDGTISLVSGELGLWRNIFNPIKASLVSLTINFYTYNREKILLEPILNASIFSKEELPDPPTAENIQEYKVGTYNSWKNNVNNLCKHISIIFKITTYEKENTEHCLITQEIGLREKHRKWNLDPIDGHK